MTTRLLLCSDLDRTLLPNGPQPESSGARERFAAIASRPEVTLAYVSGRHRELVEQAMVNYCLPRPDYVIGDVGTTIYEITAADWYPWREWEAEIAPDWAGLSHADLRTLLDGVSTLHLQEPAKQNLYKLSYYVPLDADDAASTAAIQRLLRLRGVDASLVWSVDEPAGVGLLDILPARANKLHAVEFLRQRHGFAYSQTLFAGDSGNDLPVLVSAIPAVLVANASAEVRDAAQEQATRLGHADALYIARGGLSGMNGNYSAGVLEGLVHFFPHTAAWLEQEEVLHNA
jgi:HAD superfamily hydrolase (TIGR01484 family)